MGQLLAPPRLRPAAACAALLCASALLTAAPPAVALEGGVQDALDAALETAQDALSLVRIEGTVLMPDGTPARGAVVVSSAGGQAAVGEDGSFAFELELGAAAVAVELTALAQAPGGLLIARGRADGLRGGQPRH